MHDRWQRNFQICFWKVVLVLPVLGLDELEEELSLQHEPSVLLLQLVEYSVVCGEEWHTDVVVMLHKSPSDGVLHFHQSDLPLSLEFERLCELISKQRRCVVFVESLAPVSRLSDIEATSW